LQHVSQKQPGSTGSSGVLQGAGGPASSSKLSPFQNVKKNPPSASINLAAHTIKRGLPTGAQGGAKKKKAQKRVEEPPAKGPATVPERSTDEEEELLQQGFLLGAQGDAQEEAQAQEQQQEAEAALEQHFDLDFDAQAGTLEGHVENAMLATRAGDCSTLGGYLALLGEGEQSVLDRLLLTATLYSSPSCVETLLKHKADPNARATVKIEMAVPLDPSQAEQITSIEGVGMLLVMNPGSRKAKKILRLLRSRGLEYT